MIAITSEGAVTMRLLKRLKRNQSPTAAQPDVPLKTLSEVRDKRDWASLVKPEEARDNRIKHYEVLRDYAKHEDNLVNNRIMWILTIHGFLYATYGFTLQKILEIVEKVTALGVGARMPDTFIDLLLKAGGTSRALLVTEMFLLIIAAVGYLISYWGLKSIEAAKESVINVNKLFMQVRGVEEVQLYGYVTDLGDFVVPTTAGGGRKFADEVGSSASLKIPKILMASWGIVIIVQVVVVPFDYYVSFFQLIWRGLVKLFTG